MHGSILSLWLSLFALAPAAEAPPDEDAADLSEARRLFDEGTARYDAADFDGAIEVFTLALSELREQGVDDFRIRGLLLFNIGRAHMRAYEIDQSVEHLRQAKAIFTKFVADAERFPDQVEDQDISEAEAEIVKIDELLAALPDDDADPEPEPSPIDEPAPEARRLRASGIGLTVAGAALLGGGIGMLAFGAGFGPAAESSVAPLDDAGLPPDSEAFTEADAFVAAEKRKGAAWLGVGAVVATGGVVSLALGIRNLVRAKKARDPGVTASVFVSSEGAWLGFSGRF